MVVKRPLPSRYRCRWNNDISKTIQTCCRDLSCALAWQLTQEARFCPGLLPVLGRHGGVCDATRCGAHLVLEAWQLVPRWLGRRNVLTFEQLPECLGLVQEYTPINPRVPFTSLGSPEWTFIIHWRLLMLVCLQSPVNPSDRVTHSSYASPISQGLQKMIPWLPFAVSAPGQENHQGSQNGNIQGLRWTQEALLWLGQMHAECGWRLSYTEPKQKR